MTLKLLTLREADELLNLRKGTLANEFYFGRLPDTVCGFVGTRRNRRVIPEENLPKIAELLQQKGK